MQQLRKDRDARVAQIEEGLRAEYRQLQRKEAELKTAIDEHKGRAADQSLKMTELESLKKQADSAAGLYSVLLQKLNETNIAASIQNNNVRLLDRAVVPSAPVWPRKRQIALVGLLAGLLLGAGFVLLRDALDNTLKDADDVERHLHLELLAAIPRYTKDDASLATEAYQNLRTALLFSRRGEHGPGRAGHRHGARRGQDHDAIERGEAARRVGRERRGRRLRPAARQPAPAPERPARAGLHRLLREERRRSRRWCGRRGSRTSRRSRPGRCRRTRRRSWRAPSSAAALAELKQQLPLGAGGLAARRGGHRRAAAGAARRLDAARGPAEQGGPRDGEARAAGAAQGDAERDRRGAERGRREDEGLLRLRVLRLAARRRRTRRGPGSAASSRPSPAAPQPEATDVPLV